MNQPEKFLGKVAQKAIIVKDNKILLTRNPKDNDIWELPGGRLHVDEAPDEGLRRELFEELGVDVEIHSVSYVEQFNQASDGSLHLLIAYRARLADESRPFVCAPDEVAETQWVDQHTSTSYKIFDNCQRALDHYWTKEG